jgi:hypothetical protein
MTSSKVRQNGLMLAGLLVVCFWQSAGAAQTFGKGTIPRVGTIKDYPATGLMTGCGNLYVYKAADAKSTDSNYVFLARGDGSNAWMNLNGRDVRLRQLKSKPRGKQNSHRLFYLYKDVRINIVFEDFKPEGVEITEGDPMFKMKITLRKGSSVRTIQAVGSSDC